MPDLIPSSIGPRYMLRIAIIDGDILEFPYASDIDAKNELEQVIYGSPGGIWADRRCYPVHRIEYAEIMLVKIITPATEEAAFEQLEESNEEEKNE